MQSDDYHLDRALYRACREDRERFCSNVAGGNGRVYRCLYEQKFNNMMSSAVSGKIIEHFLSIGVLRCSVEKKFIDDRN